MDFLKELKDSKKGRTPELDADILGILVSLCEGKNNSSFTKFTALIWLYDYLKVFLHEMDNNLTIEIIPMDLEEEKDIMLTSANNNPNAESYPINKALCNKLGEVLKAVLVCLSDDI